MMKLLGGFWLFVKRFAWAALFLSPCVSSAATRTEELKRCLNDFDGIEWKLPYQPPIQVRSCATQTATYETGDKTSDGWRILELIGELTLGPDPSHLASDETYAAVQSAAFMHFDALFRRHGYSRTGLEYGDARTRYDPNTLRMLNGEATVPETDEQAAKRVAKEPPIPYVNLARYVRQVAGRPVTLTYKTQEKNIWKIMIEGLPSLPRARGTVP